MKLKKIISSILVLTFLLSVTAFAYTDFDGEYDYIGKVSKAEVSVGDTFDLSFYIKDKNSDTLSFNMLDAMYISKLTFDNDAFELTSEATFGYDFVADQTTYSTANTTGVYQIQAGSTATNDIDIASTFFIKYSFKVKEGATEGVKSFTVENLSLADGESLADISDATLNISVDKVTVKGSEPVVISPQANTTLAGYTDVVNFESSLTGVTATSPTLAFDLYENGAKHKSYEVSLGNDVTLSGGTLSFKIAVVGAPTDKTITLVNPEVK